MTRELVNVSEAARRLAIPRTTILHWVRTERLFPRGLDAHGTALYDLDAVRHLAATTRRRRRRTRRGTRGDVT